MNLEDFMDVHVACKEMMGWVDLDPLLHLYHQDGANQMVILQGATTGPPMWAGIRTVLAQMRAEHSSPPREVYCLMDARMKHLHPERESVPTPGDLNRAWREGQQEGITECLVVYRVGADGSNECVIRSYVESARLWGPLETMPGDEGEVRQALLDGITS